MNTYPVRKRRFPFLLIVVLLFCPFLFSGCTHVSDASKTANSQLSPEDKENDYSQVDCSPEYEIYWLPGIKYIQCTHFPADKKTVIWDENRRHPEKITYYFTNGKSTSLHFAPDGSPITKIPDWFKNHHRITVNHSEFLTPDYGSSRLSSYQLYKLPQYTHLRIQQLPDSDDWLEEYAKGLHPCSEEYSSMDKNQETLGISFMPSGKINYFSDEKKITAPFIRVIYDVF